MWENVDKAEKEKYSKKADAAKVKYLKEVETYKKTHPGYDEHKRKKRNHRKNKSKEIPDGSLSED